MQETATAVFADRITCVFRNLVESMTKFTLETRNCQKLAFLTWYRNHKNCTEHREDHEEHRVNSNGTVNTAVECVLMIAPKILRLGEILRYVSCYI
jgi:hypothetical protein